ncbi:MAG: hypothetical protein KIT10_16190 [Flavobacteriales bacterium]|nr:hypothetical protein [Flavobacteriales bacterium]
MSHLLQCLPCCALACLSLPLFAQVYVPGDGVMDVEGNLYPTLIYANGQEWMAENLHTTRYTDGSEMLLIEGDAAWAAQDVPMPQYTPAYCWYDDDIANKELYGALYSWYAIDSTSNGGRSACPTGWRVPSHADWTQLVELLVANGLTYDGSTSIIGPLNKLGKSMADTALWLEDTAIVGVPGNEPEYNNAAGFTGRPGGVRGYLDGHFTGQAMYGMWWDSDPMPPAGSLQVTRYRLLLYGGQADARHLGHYYGNKMSGKSVRCLRDNGTTGMDTRPMQGHVLAFPNPFSQLLTVEAGPADVGSPFKVLNATGQVLHSGTVPAERFTLDLHDLPAGLYRLVGPGAWRVALVKEH